MKIEREWVEALIFGTDSARRFTQDSPILPDVWLAFAEQIEDAPIDLLVSPFRDMRAGEVSKVLKRRLDRERASEHWKKQHQNDTQPALIAYNKANVVATLWFDELVRVVLPLTLWWIDNMTLDTGEEVAGFIKKLQTCSNEELKALFQGDETVRLRLSVSVSVVWMIRLIGSLQAMREPPVPEGTIEGPGDITVRRQAWDAIQNDPKRILQAIIDLTERALPVEATQHMVWNVSRNRGVATSGYDSVSTIKADAAKLLFRISCSDLTWAIIDSGIDATHPAFRLRDETNPQQIPFDEPFEVDEKRSRPNRTVWKNNTRVKATYDFTLIRYLLSGEKINEKTVPPEQRETLKSRIDELNSRIARDPRSVKELRNSLAKGREVDWGLVAPLLEIPHTVAQPTAPAGEASPEQVRPSTAEAEGEVPLRVVPTVEKHSVYISPTHEHGTHVAGILAGDWRPCDYRENDGTFGQSRRIKVAGVVQGSSLVAPKPPPDGLIGVCPDLQLYDLRVLDDAGRGDEFSVMAALQFVRYLNSHKDVQAIHGANLSLSIRHDVTNYACGRTPVCEETERLVGAGIVVVVAAGNEGHLQYMTSKGPLEGYRNISITDPGNAAGVITVGSTHRTEPHTYGVSYFSSRGPTGDGRVKPDIVAPGEKIDGPVPGGQVKRMDGTSMAAPHVSGAAALLIARHRELMGQPERIKHILMSTATDLGRERYFQGAGLVDTLRALQSV